VLWQALCLAAGFSVVAGFVLLAVEPLGSSLLGGAWNWFAAVRRGDLQEPAWRLACGLAAAAITGTLLAVLLHTSAQTVRRRRAHRQVLDLLTSPVEVGGDAKQSAVNSRLRILDHQAAVAYTLPGWHSRVVLSAGLVGLVTGPELAAVIQHERAHLRVRPAGASVAELTEMLADDVAAGRTSRGDLASALAKVALSGPAPTVPPERMADSPAIAGTAVADRVRRLMAPRPLAGWQIALVYTASVLLLAIPASVLLLHWT